MYIEDDRTPLDRIRDPGRATDMTGRAPDDGRQRPTVPESRPEQGTNGTASLPPPRKGCGELSPLAPQGNLPRDGRTPQGGYVGETVCPDGPCVPADTRAYLKTVPGQSRVRFSEEIPVSEPIPAPQTGEGAPSLPEETLPETDLPCRHCPLRRICRRSTAR